MYMVVKVPFSEAIGAREKQQIDLKPWEEMLRTQEV